MKISTQALKFINQHYGSAGDPMPDGIDELAKVIGARLAGIDEIVPFGKRFEGVIVAKIISCDDHPNADRLHVCKIDDGGAVQNIERDESGYVQVVCGAPNARTGLTVAWLPPGSTVPNTFNKDPFVLEARALRGVVSNGMLASPKELSLGDSHEGILEIDREIAPGTPFADAFHLRDDYIIDMENKMFTHRPDCFGWLGIAREIEGIHHRPYKSPEWYQMNPVFPEVEVEELKLEVQNELPGLVPRFTAIVLRDVSVGPSPVWLQADLARVGIRSINNIVDYTNFFMIETGQPIHAYDYDKVMAQDKDAAHATIVIRHPKEGEKIALLNGKEIEPRPEAIMIATKDKLIGVGGVMGGADTEVDEATRNIIIEVANFDMYSIRRTSMAHGLFTDAVTRFNKGQSPLQNLAVLGKITDEVRRFAGGKVASALIDSTHLPDDVISRGSLHPPVVITTEFINTRLGFNLTNDEITRLLTNVEFSVDADSDQLIITAPFWRTDIAIPEDIVEEVGRLYGFDHLPLELPIRNLTPAVKDPLFELKQRIRSSLSAAGANEVLTYSFVHGDLLKKATQDTSRAFQLSNALSPDLQYYRFSILPSLLEKVRPNIKSGHSKFALFELGKGHDSTQVAGADGLPAESEILGMVVTAADKIEKPGGAAFYQARAFLDQLVTDLGMKLAFSPTETANDNPMLQPYDPARSALVSDMATGVFLGVIGEFKNSVLKSLRLPAFTAGFELDLGVLLACAGEAVYQKLSRFPRIEQDICLRVDSKVSYRSVFNLVEGVMLGACPAQTLAHITPIDIYQRENDARKQITLRISLVSYERTLTDNEASSLLDQIAAKAQQELAAERI